MSPMHVAFVLLLMPDLAELQRFPSLNAANSRIGVLIEQRYFIRLRLSLDRNKEQWQKALEANGRTLACWEALLEARGGLAEEEAADTSDEARQGALALLRQLLGERNWAAGQMP